MGRDRQALLPTRGLPDTRGRRVFGLELRRSFAAEIDHFIDAVGKGIEPLHSVNEATDTLRIVMAAYEATDSNRIVTL